MVLPNISFGVFGELWALKNHKYRERLSLNSAFLHKDRASKELRCHKFPPWLVKLPGRVLSLITEEETRIDTTLSRLCHKLS